MGAANQQHYDRLRSLHYPADRNQVPAHITLFHHLPPSVLPELSDMMRQMAADNGPLRGQVSEILSLGKGTAFRVQCPELLALRAEIADHFYGMIAQQDQAVPRLHITVQNKVSRDQAIELQRDLARSFRPHSLEIIGLAAFHYRDGPWEPAFSVRFRGTHAKGRRG